MKLNADKIIELFGDESEETELINCLNEDSRNEVSMILYVDRDDESAYYTFEKHPALIAFALINVGERNGIYQYKIVWDALNVIGFDHALKYFNLKKK